MRPVKLRRGSNRIHDQLFFSRDFISFELLRRGVIFTDTESIPLIIPIIFL